jgi:hypothetical protein
LERWQVQQEQAWNRLDALQAMVSAWVARVSLARTEVRGNQLDPTSEQPHPSEHHTRHFGAQMCETRYCGSTMVSTGPMARPGCWGASETSEKGKETSSGMGDPQRMCQRTIEREWSPWCASLWTLNTRARQGKMQVEWMIKGRIETRTWS